MKQLADANSSRRREQRVVLPFGDLDRFSEQFGSPLRFELAQQLRRSRRRSWVHGWREPEGLDPLEFAHREEPEPAPAPRVRQAAA